MSTVLVDAHMAPTRTRLDLAHAPLPPVARPDARLAVLDTTEWFAPTSGGIRTYLLQKSSYVAARPWLRQALVVPSADDGIQENEGSRWYECHGPRIPGNAPYRMLTSVAKMRRVLEHERPDVIEIGSPALVPWLVFRALGDRDVPIVNFFHSHFPALARGSYRPTKGWRYAARDVAWWYARRLDRRVSATIAASRFVADDLTHAGIENVVHIPLGVDLEHFTPARRADAAATRAAWKLPADAPIFTFVGRFAHEKELGVLMDAWPAIARLTGAVLVMAGDGPDRVALQQRSRGADVHWLPFISDRSKLADLMAASTVYLATSPHETFGLSPLEAMACGTPILAADGGGVREHVMGSGAGSIFTPGDAANLAERAVELLHSDLGAHGARARAFAEREHSWNSVFDRVFALYASLQR